MSQLVCEAWRADWRDPAQYPPDDVSMAVIAWQILRRDEAYAADYAAATKAQSSELDARTAGSWGMACLVSPACSGPPCWLELEPAAAAPIFSFAIDLGAPLTRQFNAARLDASQRAREWRAKHPEVRKRMNKSNRGFYVDLLRVIDAVNAGAETDEIRNALWPHLAGQSSRGKLRYMLKRAEELMESDLTALATCDVEHSPGNGARADLSFQT